MSAELLKKAIRDIPDFPQKGIVFKDITPILKDPALFNAAIDLLASRHKGSTISRVAVIESRGFIFGTAIARELGVGIIPIRKKGKLPYETIEETYDLEYGSATLEIHTDAVEKGETILLVDDLLATGGTAKASAKLIERLGGKIAEIQFLIELSFLNGRDKLKGYDVFAPVVF